MSMELSMFQVTGMHCQGCANTVSAALRGLDGVTGVEVDLPATVRVHATRTVSVAEVAEALHDDEEFTVVAQ